jgi:hypothetical protein
MPDKLVMTTHLGEGANAAPVEIYERTQIVMAGSVMVPVVVENYYVLGAPTDWPKVQIKARRRLGRWLYRWGKHRGIMLDDARFNARFRVTSKDETFAIMLLNPELQGFILEKQDVDWSAGEGAIKLWYRGKLNKRAIPRALDRLARFERLIAPELFG